MKSWRGRRPGALNCFGLVFAMALTGCDTQGPRPLEPAEVTGPSALAGATFFADPDSPAAEQARQWRVSRPSDAALIDRIASRPVARWLSGGANVQTAVDREVSRAAAAGALPLLVAYNIPNRNLSGGGAASAEAYRLWIREFATGLAGRPAVVVLEPDALPHAAGMSNAARDERFTLLRDAIQVLDAANAFVYLDAGNARWHAPAVLADLLNAAGIAQADGFALNVANYIGTSVSVTYGTSVSRLVGGKHFIVDTGRNGVGGTADNQWCNPPGQGLGAAPSVPAGPSLVDALLWIKQPGESDGPCNGGPVAGVWWAENALGLAQRQAAQ